MEFQLQDVTELVRTTDMSRLFPISQSSQFGATAVVFNNSAVNRRPTFSLLFVSVDSSVINHVLIFAGAAEQYRRRGAEQNGQGDVQRRLFHGHPPRPRRQVEVVAGQKTDDRDGGQIQPAPGRLVQRCPPYCSGTQRKHRKTLTSFLFR